MERQYLMLKTVTEAAGLIILSYSLQRTKDRHDAE